MKKDEIKNKELYDYIVKYYVKAKDPVSQEEIAKHFNLTLGSVKNFLYRHKLNKKEYYNKRYREIIKLYIAGIKTKTIAKIFDTTSENVYRIVYEKMTASDIYV